MEYSLYIYIQGEIYFYISMSVTADNVMFPEIRFTFRWNFANLRGYYPNKF